MIQTSKNPFVIYEDNHLLALYKPPAMPVVPDSSCDYSLLDWGKDYIKKTKNKPGNVFLAVIHRIDRPVSGLVLFARTSKAASRLSDQMRKHLISKRYLAVVSGCPESDGDTIETFIKKDRKRNRVTITHCDTKGAKRAITRWTVLSKRQYNSLLCLEPVTGRPHQLRVHMAKVLCCPILGDIKYGNNRPVLSGKAIALHSWSIGVEHPTRKELVRIVCPIPIYEPFDLFQVSKHGLQKKFLSR